MFLHTKSLKNESLNEYFFVSLTASKNNKKISFNDAINRDYKKSDFTTRKYKISALT
jgi:hypothetical protein